MSFLVLLPGRSSVIATDFGMAEAMGREARRRVVYNVYGGVRPTVFKTFRNAKKVATSQPYGYERDEQGLLARDGQGKLVHLSRDVPGLVMKFDPGYLPIVSDPETLSSPNLERGKRHLPPANRYQPLWEPDGPKNLDEEYALAERQMLLWQERVLYLKQQLSTTE